MNTANKILCLLPALFLVFLITSCAPSGYYDSNGQYRAYGVSDSFNHNHAMAGTPTTPSTYSDAVPASNTTIIYTRPGYYDRNGNYVTADKGPHVAEGFFPPRGMCRMWFTDRPAQDEPTPESCTGIQSRVPAGAYVIYGG